MQVERREPQPRNARTRAVPQKSEPTKPPTKPEQKPKPKPRPKGKPHTTSRDSIGANPNLGKFFTHHRAVKIEFLVGLALFLLAPMSQPQIKMDKNYARRLIAWVVLFMLLFPMATSDNPQMSRAAAWLGGLILLTLAVLGGNPSKSFGGFSVNVSKILADIVAKLQPQKGP
jgi:hypothetical protein